MDFLREEVICVNDYIIQILLGGLYVCGGWNGDEIVILIIVDLVEDGLEGYECDKR